MRTEQERVAEVLPLLDAVTRLIDVLPGIPDPVQRRRSLVRAAAELRAAADALDDHGFLTA